MLINKNGFWENSSLDGHAFDSMLSNSISKFCIKNKIETAYDFGCGHGRYTMDLNNAGITCKGFDGNPHTKIISNDFCDVLDLTTDFKLDKVDLLLSLEVGEHIPSEFEDHIIKKIKDHTSKYVVLSWAVEGQGGDGHVNCRNNNYIKEKFKDGFINLVDEEEYFRKNCELSWFKNTIMVFKKLE